MSIVEWRGRLYALAPGQFWMLIVVGLAVAGYSGYRYYIIPEEQREEWADLERFSTAMEKARISRISAMIVAGYPQATIDSTSRADFLRSIGDMNGLTARQQAQDARRPLYLAFAICMLVLILGLTWGWFGRSKALDST